MLLLILLIIVAALVFAGFRWRRHELDTARARIVDFVVRLRNHLLGGAGLLLYLAPELADVLRDLRWDPDVAAFVPAGWLRLLGVLLLIVGAYARFRPASRADDAEVTVKRTLDDLGEPAVVVVHTPGGEPTQISVSAAGKAVEVR